MSAVAVVVVVGNVLEMETRRWTAVGGAGLDTSGGIRTTVGISLPAGDDDTTDMTPGDPDDPAAVAAAAVLTATRPRDVAISCIGTG